ncbi:MAG TPA: hypothetical protein PK954_03105 [Anaerolineales bacterium]|nr:hypothetical protein [Anaerolineales bacterium]
MQRKPPDLRLFEPGATAELPVTCDQGEPGGISRGNARSGRLVGALGPCLDRDQQPAGAQTAEHDGYQTAQ